MSFESKVFNIDKQLKSASIVFLILFLSCNSPAKHKPAINKATLANKPPSAKNSEYMDWDSVKLNGNIPMVSSFKTLVIIWGKPDSIVTPNYENISSSYFDGDFKYCYYPNIQFEKEGDSIAFRSIDFRKSKEFYLLDNKIKLSNTTTIDDFKKLFPKTVENNELHGTDMDKNRWIRLATSSNDGSDDAWDFLFDRNTGKLLSVEYWIDD